MTTDDVTHLRALLAEQTARAERAETLVERAEVAFHAAITRANEALAACAEMRAALESAAPHHQGGHSTVGRMIREALSRPDLGAGMVVVEREVVERVRDVLQRLPRAGWGYTDAERAAVADLDALLKKGGG